MRGVGGVLGGGEGGTKQILPRENRSDRQPLLQVRWTRKQVGSREERARPTGRQKNTETGQEIQ